MSSLVEVKNLRKYFSNPKGELQAVSDVNLAIEEGTTLGVVGESGCGKSTLGRTIIHLLEPTGGQIFFQDKDVTRVNTSQLRELRHNMQIVFQDPYSSLNPRKTVEDTIQEPLKNSKRFSRAEILEQTDELMSTVGIDRRMRRSFPHELDGGRRQRVGIARALAMNPKFIVCDEPVSALDVSIQAQILNLLKELQEKKNLTYMFITHDMSVVRHLSDNICVMYLGHIVEIGPTKAIFEQQFHPYTKALLSAVPSTNVDNPKRRIIMKGELSSPINPKPGCRFATRCMYDSEMCHEPQTLREIANGHFMQCCRAEEVLAINKKSP
jgi:peptide/nickel transport system ATP-binding protein